MTEFTTRIGKLQRSVCIPHFIDKALRFQEKIVSEINQSKLLGILAFPAVLVYNDETLKIRVIYSGLSRCVDKQKKRSAFRWQYLSAEAVNAHFFNTLWRL